MILRLFFTLLIINIAIFAASVDASEQIGSSDRSTVKESVTMADVKQLQAVMAGRSYATIDQTEGSADILAEVGSRLLTLSLTRRDTSRRYAYETIRADHGFSLIDEGACLNLKWTF
jgi:hypothetical protein